ncbi:serine--tRNA synthetase-like protein Slimp [Achroia grisella]|uniref:serine--tRNA synthetase-like protein Slimp n=1 Tax=Achroia grisella TaxID=688607 RepID=UPI0027D241BB|nr:serine--tRNA synthetase-like protein Slimp [Achroia grisella]
MIRKSILSLAIRLRDCRFMSVRKSALFMNGTKATENFVYVIPYIDFSNEIKRKDLIQEQLIKRKLNIDLTKVESLWSIYQELKQRKSEFEKKKEEISKELGKIIKNDPENVITEKLKIQLNLLKDNIRKLKEPLWSAEEAAILEILKLPNSLHSRTPHCESKVLYTHLLPPTEQKDHLIIGRDLGLIEFIKNENYYLKGTAAIFELGAKFYFNNILRNNNFQQFSNPDFVKSLVLEGCGIDHTNANSSFILHHNEDSKVNVDSRLHLTGGGSLCSFFAYYTKNVLHAKSLPLKYFTMGRQYIPSASEENSLFHVSQSSVVEIFCATKNEKDLDTLLDDLIEILKSTYSELGYHFRLSLMPADKLHTWESLRLIFEMYSTSLQTYVEIGNISVIGDYVSKRLMFTYVENKESHFPHILSGTIFNVPKFLGCVLEQDNDFSLPKEFALEKWKL